MFNDWVRQSPEGAREVLLEERHPARPAAGEPYCTRSRIVSYQAGGVDVARAHRYQRPDGSLGASGMPDPKLFFDGARIYVPGKG